MVRAAEAEAPYVTRVAVLRDAATSAGIGQFGAIETAAPSFGVEVSPVGVRDAEEIERAVTNFAHSANGGLIVTQSALTLIHRNLIVTLAAQHKLPAVYTRRLHVTDGGLVAYGPDRIDQYRRAASYVDRILKGEKPAAPAGAGAEQVRACRSTSRPRRPSASPCPDIARPADEVIE